MDEKKPFSIIVFGMKFNWLEMCSMYLKICSFKTTRSLQCNVPHGNTTAPWNVWQTEGRVVRPETDETNRDNF